MHRPYTQPGMTAALDQDRLAVERYRYLLRTAPPDQLERAHEEAFASLTPEQRRMVLETLQREVEPAESRGVTDDPADLARLATRTELRRPGTMERAFGGGVPSGPSGAGGGAAFGGFLPTLAGAFMGTAIASMLFGGLGGFGPSDAAGFEGGAMDAGSDADTGAVADGGIGDDAGGRSFGGEWGDGGDPGDLGGDPGDLGGDAGGFGDLGGFGDFGGGDFGGFDL
jgi:hypothetical protein